MAEFFSNIKNPLLLRPGQALRLALNENKEDIIFSSQDSYVISALKNGKIIGNQPGFASVQILEKGKKAAEIFFEVVPGESKLPVLFNRYNRITRPASELLLLEGEYTESGKPVYICKCMREALLKLLKAAESEGIIIRVFQGYRSVSDQFEILEKYTERDGNEAAIKRCAPPCYSEHHTGLALDLGGGRLEKGKYIPDPKSVYTWIADNCYKFDFMIKNLPGKEEITGTIPEPWHIRYVGNPEAAKRLHDEKLSMDEYVDMNSELIGELELSEITDYSKMQRRQLNEENKKSGEENGQSSAQMPQSREAEEEVQRKMPAVPEKNIKKLKIGVMGELILPEYKFPDSAEISDYIKNYRDIFADTDICFAGAAMDSTQGGMTEEAKQYIRLAARQSGTQIYFLPKSLPYIENEASDKGGGRLIKIKDIYLGVASFTLADTMDYDSPSAVISVNKLEDEIFKIEYEINALKQSGAEFVLVYFHWGDRFLQDVTAIQKYVTIYAGRHGADAVFGSGSWNAQQYKCFKIPSSDGSRNMHCFYSLGIAMPLDEIQKYAADSSGIITELTLNYDMEKHWVSDTEAKWKPIFAENVKAEICSYKCESDSSAELKKYLNARVNNNKPESIYLNIMDISEGQILRLSGDVFPEADYKGYKSDDAAVAYVTETGWLLANSSGCTGVTAVKQDGSKVSYIIRVNYEGRYNELPVIVNTNNSLKDDYVPQNLVGGLEYALPQNTMLEQETARAWKRMRDDAREVGILLCCVGGYRSHQDQLEKISRYASRYGQAAAKKRYMPAGCSEHHLGTSLDIAGMKTLTEKTSTPAAIQWVWENAYKYGFIPRRSKIDVSKLAYVHVRYMPFAEVTEKTGSAEELVNELIEKQQP